MIPDLYVYCHPKGTSEVHPSAVEAAPNGDALEDPQMNGMSRTASAWSGYKHPGGLVGRKACVCSLTYHRYASALT